ncbi:uncharacterized protein J8A68_003135 [[Candida] subhashii]|uniref:F-box domain-containing protein n=1 Tax=[Candida] subhashii TaxID=561895 RepID=A0A8J5QI19_9ASCO|nr:uncharacterized protein J8A68_003135 [[Candida] subhashii]KAG7663387.1 hypothetical protein J8A68_003135 [[Candida] subhashii]
MAILFTDLPDDILYLIYHNLEIFTIKRLQYVSKLTRSTQQYIFTHSQYRLLIDDNKKAEELELPGYLISKLLIPNNHKMIKHIGQFKYFLITISIYNFEDTLKLMNEYVGIFEQLFKNHDGIPNKNKYIRLFIQLHYSLNTFNDVKDCLSNIDRISHFFNRYEGTNVQIDLELNRR